MKIRSLILLASFVFVFGLTSSASAQENTMKKIGDKVVDTTKDVARGTKKVGKTVYRKGAVVGNRVWTGTKWVARSAWKGGTWVAVKTKNGTKWVYRKGRNVVTAAKKPVP